MAYAFLRGLGCDGNIGEITMDMNGNATSSSEHKLLASKAGSVELESTRYPFCFDGNQKSSDGTRSIAPFFPFNDELNRFTLKVKNLSAEKAKVTWGEESKEFTRAQLESGINLAAEFSKTPFDAQFKKLVQAVGAKQNFETPMIKSMVTSYRQFSNEAKDDPELASAFAKVSERLTVRQQQLDKDMRKTIVPVKHTIAVTAL
jgi:hypothetical protein